MPTIANGSSVTLTVTSTQQILLNSGPAVRCDIEATSGVTGADTRRKVATHRGGYGIYGPFGSGTVTLFAIGGSVDYDDSVPLNGSDERTNVLQDPSTGAVTNAAGAQILPVQRQLILNAASSGTDSGWLPISPAPERFVYQLTTGSTSTGFTVDISADGSTSLGQAFTGTWASSTTAYITGPISFSNPLARFFRVTVTSGGPISFARGA